MQDAAGGGKPGGAVADDPRVGPRPRPGRAPESHAPSLSLPGRARTSTAGTRAG